MLLNIFSFTLIAFYLKFHFSLNQYTGILLMNIGGTLLMNSNNPQIRL